MYLSQAKERFQELNLASSDELKPCTDEEIETLERHLRLSLPKAYREFLLWMGNGAGVFMLGEDCFYRQLFDLRRSAIELLEENCFSKKLPDDAFVFFMHQGYHFGFLLTSQGENPPIHYYYEGRNKDDFTFASFNSLEGFLLKKMEGQAQTILKLKKLD
ncbi:SMI1/KNR4 family protein [Kovacikia minuta CCNUW1]|uniref:SMI1/KNR4 family protein n=1 Tax=Kovacikia minuta TaxID=2931930 RepID=UPI001CCDE2E8|nr:SMI1/KNR4 family protein [Kovacikia minuta]UBF27657.1 SMI1/KNR4 family protein [Kovacikia minuta CCNUW1]